MPWQNQVSGHFCTSCWSCLGIVWCGKYTGLLVIVGMVCLMRLKYPRSSSHKEKTSLFSYTRLRKWFCWSHINLASFPMFSWKGSWSILFLKLNSVELVSGLGPNSGFSILGLLDWMGLASTWLLLVSISWEGTGWNPTEMLLPSWFIFVLYPISSHSTSNNLAANKGCLIYIHYTCWCS